MNSDGSRSKIDGILKRTDGQPNGTARIRVEQSMESTSISLLLDSAGYGADVLGSARSVSSRLRCVCFHCKNPRKLKRQKTIHNPHSSPKMHCLCHAKPSKIACFLPCILDLCLMLPPTSIGLWYQIWSSGNILQWGIKPKIAPNLPLSYFSLVTRSCKSSPFGLFRVHSRLQTPFQQIKQRCSSHKIPFMTASDFVSLSSSLATIRWAFRRPSAERPQQSLGYLLFMIPYWL
jgi:hypothetical protein